MKMIKNRKNTFGYAHHLLLGILVVAIIAFAGIRVLTGTHALIPAESARIGDAATISPSSDQTQTIDATDSTCSPPIPAASKNYPPDNTPSSEEELTTLNVEVAKAINAFRAAHGISPPLSYKGSELHASAKQHTMEMGKYGYLDHNTPKKTPGHLNGWCWYKRIAHFYPKGDNSYYTRGENIVFSSPNLSAAYAMYLWKHSPEHRRNLLDPNWRDLGVSAVKVTGLVGDYAAGCNGDCYDSGIIITTDFGARH